MELLLDDWQKEVMDTQGNICLRSGRQVGKSTIISIKAGEHALNNPKTNIMVIAAVERQAALLFEKILAHIYQKDKTQIKKGKHRPTKHKLQLKNGSVIHCLPTGDSGYGIRGFTINLLIADEAAFIPEDVWTAVTPMLTITKGDIWLLSTPHGREGFYYRCFDDAKYTAFHVSALECPRKDDDFLNHEREWMTEKQFAQEYLGEFVDDLMQFFPNTLIDKTCILRKPKEHTKGKYYLGCDVARMGRDESTFQVLDRRDPQNLTHIESSVTKKTLTTETTKKILEMDNFYNFKKIYIDDGGFGVAIFDQLLNDPKTRRKVIPINNASRSLDKDTWKKKLLKEDLYNNLLRLMERKEIKLLFNENVKLSLRSIQYEIDEQKKRLRIHGNYSHIVEGLIRAAWCVKDKHLKMWMRCT